MAAFKSSFFTLVLLALGAVASPVDYSATLANIPRGSGVAAVALDERSGTMLAYRRDGSLYGRVPVVKRDPAAATTTSKRAATTCSNLSVEEAKTLPGWNAIEQYAKDNWGDGSYNLVTNPEEYLDSPAQACVDGEPVAVEQKGDPVCTAQNGSTDAEAVGTSGSVAVKITSGYKSTTSWTTTKSSTLGVSVKLGVTLKVPEIAEITAETTTSTEFTNELSSSFGTEVNTLHDDTFTINAKEGQKCRVDYKSSTCKVEGVGKIRTVATGWVWFNYDDKTKDHYKWAAHIDEIIKNIDDRSSFAEFTGSMHAETTTDFKGACE